MIDYSQEEIETISDQRLAAEIKALQAKINGLKFDIRLLGDEIFEIEEQLKPLTDEQDAREAGGVSEQSTPAIA